MLKTLRNLNLYVLPKRMENTLLELGKYPFRVGKS